MCSSWFIVMNFSCTFDELWNSKKDHLENGSKRRLSQKPKKYSKWWFEVLQGVSTCDQCSWICGLVVRIWFFCNLVTRCLTWLHLWEFDESDHVIPVVHKCQVFEEGNKIKFSRLPWRWLVLYSNVLFAIFPHIQNNAPPVIYRDHKIFFKLI